MKKQFFIIIILSIGNYLFAQNSRTIYIPIDYSLSVKSPLISIKGDTIINNCDSVYLVNKSRFKFYREIHLATLSNNTDSLNRKILNTYDKSLRENQEAYDKLLNNCKESEKITFEMIKYTQNSLINTQKTLDYSQKSLEQSLQSLTLVNEILKKEKWNSIGQKAWIGVGGIGVGLLIGLLIIK